MQESNRIRSTLRDFQRKQQYEDWVPSVSLSKYKGYTQSRSSREKRDIFDQLESLIRL